LFPMGALSVGSIFSGFFFKDLFIGLGTPVWGASIFVSPTHAYEFGAEFVPYVFKAVPLIFSLLGIGLVLVLYGRLGFFISRLWLSMPVILSLLGKKWYFDSFYNRIFVLPSLLGGYSIFFKLLDKGLIELLGPTGAVSLVSWLSNNIKSLQSGYIHSYVTLLVLGLVVLFFIP
jgi:NADH:ubiquinone oxidoreductase subunit 5 (subunit L)/multisubunit Na+/H+ antiporter MnhA subunit